MNMKDTLILSSESTTLKMYPVCECGYVFKNLEFDTDIYQKRFNINTCPSCNKYITIVQAPSLQPLDGIVKFYVED